MPAANGPSTGKSSAALASTGAPQGGTRDAISQWRRPVVAAAEVRKGSRTPQAACEPCALSASRRANQASNAASWA